MNKILKTVCLLNLMTVAVVTGFTAQAASTTYTATSSVFTYYGFQTTNYPAAPAGTISSIGISSASELGKFPPVQVSFDLTGTNCGVIIDAYDYVNNAISGAYFTLTEGSTTTYFTNAIMAGPGFSPNTINLNLPNNITHHLVLSIKGNFGGVTVQTGNTISSYALPKPNLLIVEGDSYTEGYNPTVKISGYQSFWFDGWVWQLGKLQPNTIVVPSGISGTGFIAPPTYGSRVVADICTLYSNAVASGKYNQIFITASGTINDLGVASGTLFNAATNVYSILQNACPQAHIFVLGNWLGAGGRLTPQNTDIVNDAALFNAAVAVGLPYFSPIQSNIRNAGNYNVFFPAGTDSVHPCAAGYAIMAQWVNTNLAYTFGTNWDANSKQGSGTLFYRLTVNNGTGTGNYTNGQIINITATNIFGTRFTNWSGDVLPDVNQASTTITMPAFNAAVTANLVDAPTGPVINVTDYGAVGDATSITVQTTINSPVVTTLGANQFTSADIGKVIEIWGAGPLTTAPNHQDLVAIITGVSGLTLTLNKACGATLASAYAVYGTNNSGAFQACIDAIPTNDGTKINIIVPAGNYLLFSPQALDNNYTMSSEFGSNPALTITKGGIHFIGSGTNTILTGCGAFQIKGSWVYRGSIFFCTGPIANSQTPLIFENLTFDGGVTTGLTGSTYFPASNVNGDGWDVTHHALCDYNPYPATPQMHQMKVFTNCVFQHWRGEMVICFTGDGGNNTFNDLANCTFQDGNASANNLYYGQHIHGCTFRNLVKVMEYYQDNATLPSVYENNYSTNAGNAISIVGARTTRNQPSFTIQNNVFYGHAGVNQIHFAPAENITVISNTFYGQAPGVVFSGVGVQPTDGTATIISNIVVACNAFNDSALPINMDGYPVSTVLVSNNTSTAIGAAFATVAGGWKTNIVYVNNASSGWLDASGMQSGSYPFDTTNNQFASLIWSGGAYAPTNSISYSGGRFHAVAKASSTFFLDDSRTDLIPKGATLSIKNTDSSTALIYSSGKLFQSSLSGPKASLAPGQTIDYAWTNGFWKRIVVTTTPPQNLAPGP